MRKLIYATHTTLDGNFDHTNGVVNEETYEYHMNLMKEIDLHIYGRKTYELMVPYWPDIAKSHAETKSENDFADVFVTIKKLVFSRTLASSDDGNIRITNADLKDEILKLKQENGKNMLTGGVSLPSELIELGLIDEFIFIVSPIIAGEGRRLLEGTTLPEKLRLKLIDSKVFKSGAVALRYSK